MPTSMQLGPHGSQLGFAVIPASRPLVRASDNIEKSYLPCFGKPEPDNNKWWNKKLIRTFRNTRTWQNNKWWDRKAGSNHSVNTDKTERRHQFEKHNFNNFTFNFSANYHFGNYTSSIMSSRIRMSKYKLPYFIFQVSGRRRREANLRSYALKSMVSLTSKTSKLSSVRSCVYTQQLPTLAKQWRN